MEVEAKCGGGMEKGGGGRREGGGGEGTVVEMVGVEDRGGGDANRRGDSRNGGKGYWGYGDGRGGRAGCEEVDWEKKGGGGRRRNDGGDLRREDVAEDARE